MVWLLIVVLCVCFSFVDGKPILYTNLKSNFVEFLKHDYSYKNV